MRKAFFGDICRVLKSGSGQAGLETTGFFKGCPQLGNLSCSHTGLVYRPSSLPLCLLDFRAAERQRKGTKGIPVFHPSPLINHFSPPNE